MAIKFSFVDLLSLKLLNFMLVITYFGTPRSHHIYQKDIGGASPPPPHMWLHIFFYTGLHLLCNSLLDNYFIFIRKLKNADQIYLMKLKLNKHIGSYRG